MVSLAVGNKEEQKSFSLNKNALEDYIERRLNESDWKILMTLFNDPLISNRKISEEVALSIEGVSSSLRKMYKLFKIEESGQKKLSLVKKTLRICKGD